MVAKTERKKIMIANKYKISKGVGRSENYLPSFDKALLDAGVGNYNLVRLSSIMPACAEEVQEINLKEGSLLPTAYATVTSDKEGDILFSGIALGIPLNEEHVGVIMEYSAINKKSQECLDTLYGMVQEAFEARNWDLKAIKCEHAMAEVGTHETVTTFACISEWW